MPETHGLVDHEAGDPRPILAGASSHANPAPLTPAADPTDLNADDDRLARAEAIQITPGNEHLRAKIGRYQPRDDLYGDYEEPPY